MGKITCVHGIKVGMCRCRNDNHGGTGKCPPECLTKGNEETVSGTTCCNVQAGSCFCGTSMKEILEFIEATKHLPDGSKIVYCEGCDRLVPEKVESSGLCWKCHVGSVQKGNLK